MNKIHLLLLLGCFSVSVCAQPLRIAHRGGTADAPENTIVAIEQSLRQGVDSVWVTVQLSRDGVPVLYRPAALDALTDRGGPVSALSAQELAGIDAGWKTGGTPYPWRGKGVAIPTLESVLQRFVQTTFFIDLKSPDADAQSMALALQTVLQRTGSLGRVRVYSTETRYLDALATVAPDVPRFESRDDTRAVLAEVALSHRCSLPASGQRERWFGLEMKREVEVVEKFTLGEARSKALLVWDEEAMACFRSQGAARIVLFGINSEADYRQAKALGADAVMIDSPALFRSIAR